jgi:hypothetical protein
MTTTLPLHDPDLMASPEAWRAFAPGLHVGDEAVLSARQRFPLVDDAPTNAERQMRAEGYFQLPPGRWDLPLDRMAETVARLAALDAPPVLAFHFDEFWLMFAGLQRLLCGLLGDNPRMLPDFWAWHIDPAGNEAGWAPHRDRGRASLLPDGRPKVLTLWLPLTDATPENSCIYVVPADRDPTYGTAEEYQHQFSLADIRALPARQGSVLGWDQAVLHWGSHAATRKLPPRISIACEFQRRDAEPYGAPLFDPRYPPDFTMRQALIGRQILRYEHMVSPDPRWRAYAERMAG